MSINIDLEALAVEHLKSEHFANYLADCISTLYRDKLMDEFNNKISEELDTQVKETVIKYLQEIGQERIEGLVNQAIRSISKKELLEKL